MIFVNRNLWKKFLLNLKNGDYKPVGRALLYFSFKIAGLILALPAIVVLWALKPFIWLKVCKLHHSRIGHLASETEIFLRRRQLGIFPDGPFYCFLCDSRNVANRQLLIMFKRVLPIYTSRIAVSIFDGMLPLLKNTPFYQPLEMNGTEHFEFKNAEPSISFTLEEIRKGRKLLKKMNVDFDNDNYVCIFARDNAFLNKTMPFRSWNYHELRNSEIDDFIETAKYLIANGLTVIRVGSIVEKPISFSHPRLIDYSVSEYQCEFLDIFILGTCKLLIGSASGMSDVSETFGIPKVFTAWIGFGTPPLGKNVLYIPKKYKIVKTGQYLHFKEALNREYHTLFDGDFHSHNFMHTLTDAKELGLIVEDNSPQDILEATKEMLNRLEGIFQYSQEEEKLIQSFQKIWSQANPLYNDITTPIGIEWLKKNNSCIFNNKPSLKSRIN